MKKLPIIFAFGLIAAACASYAYASSLSDITYPIVELGNCADQQACGAFCDDLANKDACVEFGRKHGIISSDQAEKAKQLPPSGPGDCRSEAECRAYCSNSIHTEECIQFGEQHGLVDESQIDKAKKFVEEEGPGGCRGPQECKAYCSDQAHQDECFEFGVKKGFIKTEDAERFRKFKQVQDKAPGGCRGEQECRSYCNDPAHTEECLKFGEENGFIEKEEAVRLRKLGVITGPGGCKGAECRTYCEDPSHQAECIEFAEQNGLMSREEAGKARKFAGKTGPGGCRGEQCRDFCENPDNSESCLSFAEQEGLMPPQEIARAKKFLKASQEGGPGGCRGRQCKDYCEDAAHQEECFSFAKNNGLISQEQEKQFESGLKIRQKMQESGGPGGCKNDDECRAYCTDGAHVEECIAFASSHGGIPQEQAQQMLKQFTEQQFSGGGDFGPPGNFKRFEQEAQQRFQEFRQLEDNFRGGPGGGFGPPGGFPGGEGGSFGASGGPAGGAGFVGPGGCSSPTECIKYCTEHKEECFASGPPGSRQTGEGSREGGQSQGGFGPAGGFPQLRGNLKLEVNSSELPQNFQQLSEDERKNLFRRKFEEFHGAPPGEFPGQAPGGFQGRPGEFPGGPGRAEFPQGGFPGEGNRGTGGSDFQKQIEQQEFQRQFEGIRNQEFQRQQQEQQQRFPGFPGSGELQPGGFQPNFQQNQSPSSFEGLGTIPGTPGIFQPSNQPIVPQGTFPSGGTGDFHPPEGSFTPSSGGTFQPSGSFAPPPTGSFESAPPPSGSFESQPPPPPPPSGRAPGKSFLANFLEILR